jgi:hypothetical protein
MYRNSTAMRMRSFQSKRFDLIKEEYNEFLLDSNTSKTRSYSVSPGLISFNKCSQYRSRHSDSIDFKTKISLSFEKFGLQSSRHSSSRSRSVFSEEDHGQNRIRAISHPNDSAKSFIQRLSIRKTNSDVIISRMDRNRRKALQILITLIVEFFVCWTPLFIYHTIGTFNKNFYRSTPNVYVNLILLFSFASASCNPLTYYFMSKRYRSVLYAYLSCCFFNKNQEIFIYQKNHQARHLIEEFHPHQQKNSIDKSRKESIPINNHEHRSRLKSETSY